MTKPRYSASIRGRVMGAMTAVAVAAIVQALLFVEPVVDGRETFRIEREVRDVAAAAAHRLDRGDPPERVVEDVGQLTGARLVVFGANGRVIADSARDASPPDPSAPELEIARHGGTAVAQRVPRGGQIRRLFVAARTEGGLVVRADRGLDEVDGLRGQLRLIVLAVGLGSLVLALAFAELVTRGLLRPLDEIRRAQAAFAAGDLTARVRSLRHDEVAVVAKTFDEMADALAKRVADTTEGEAQLGTILDAMVEAVFVTDPEGRIVLTNAALARMTGPNVLGRTAIEAIRSPELHDAVAGALRGKATSVQIETRIGFDPRVLAAQVAPRRGGGAVAVLHDVTELKLADTVRRDFVANASHELRTPLTAIRGFAETLRDGAMSNPETGKRFLGRILEHSVRLQRLVDDLLSLSRAESPDVLVELVPVDVSLACARVLRGLEAQAAEKRVTLSLEPIAGAADVLADEHALDHVLVNLIENGVKYTPEGGRVAVSGRIEPTHVVIEVSDTGPGIASSHLPRIFERFYRVDGGRARDVGGTGLGLAIVKHLVQRMGGEVGVDSRVGKGTTFRVRLPRALESDSRDEDEAQRAKSVPATLPN